MNKAVARSTMIAATAVWIIVSVCVPSALSDSNPFLKDFVGSDLLAFLGVVVTITLASAANIHFELNKLEEKKGKRGSFPNSRFALRRSAGALIGMLLVAVALLVLKADLPSTDTAQSFVNGAAVLIVLFNVLVLVDLTQMAFKIGPEP